MNFDLRSALPFLVPKAIAWAEQRSAEILANGFPLDAASLSIARHVGVAQPDHVRVLMVPKLPQPSDPQLQQAAVVTGLLGPGMVGLTLGYGIYICNGYYNTRLLSHESRHVHQYEQAGSIAAYLPIYLKQIVDVGYANCPFEVDARQHEIQS
ncbi:MAG: hypothetical protein ACREEL_11645 [Stellaceae bacterium]